MNNVFTPEQQAANRETLKAQLRSHADTFYMLDWIDHDAYASFPETLEQFERCGTSCCIDGMAALLFATDKRAAIGHAVKVSCGLPASICYVASWDVDLHQEYRRACNSDHAAMVEAACEQIDRFADRMAAK